MIGKLIVQLTSVFEILKRHADAVQYSYKVICDGRIESREIVLDNYRGNICSTKICAEEIDRLKAEIEYMVFTNDSELGEVIAEIVNDSKFRRKYFRNEKCMCFDGDKKTVATTLHHIVT